MASDREIVPKQRQEVDAFQALIERARFDPVWFAKEILQLKPLEGEPTLEEDPDGSWELDQWQEEMLEAACDVVRRIYGKPTKRNHKGIPLVTVRACQGPGKTFGAALILHWFQFCFPGLAVCTAPKLDSVTKRLFFEFIKIRGRSVPWYAQLMDVGGTVITWKSGQIEFERRWAAIAETGRSAASLQGYHGKYILAIIDEASGVADEMVAVIRGAMSTGRVCLGLMIGNPNLNTGIFADSHLRADLAGDYYRMHVSFENSKRVSREWVAQMARQFKKTSPTYKIRCLGDFADSSEAQLIPRQWIMNARNQEFSLERGDGSLPRMRLSVDVADGGIDETVITLAYHYATKIVFVRQWRFSFEPAIASVQAAEEAMKLWSAWGMRRENGDDIVVDSLGVGAGTAGTLMRANYPTVVYKGGESSDDPQRFRVKRVQSYYNMRDAFRDGHLVLLEDFTDDWADLEGQLGSIEMRPTGERVEDLMTKDEMKREGIKSPDCADSMAMQFATAAAQLVSTRFSAPAPLSDQIVVTPATALEGYFGG